MTLPMGDITIGMVAAELGIGLPLSLGDPRVRALAGKPNGPISLGDLRGKSAYTPPSIVCDTYTDGFSFGAPGEFLSASASPSFVIQHGEAPFEVTWTRVSGSNLISSGGGATPTFYSDGPANWARSAVFRATVKDNRNNTVVSPDVEVNLRAGDLA